MGWWDWALVGLVVGIVGVCWLWRHEAAHQRQSTAGRSDPDDLWALREKRLRNLSRR